MKARIGMDLLAELVEHSVEEALADDDNNHGTHVAGIIAGRNANDALVGVAPGTVICQSKGQRERAAC